MSNLKYVLDVTFNSDFDFEYIKKDVERYSIKEWAEEKGYEFFLTTRGVAFKGEVPASYKVDCDGKLTISLNGEDWDTMERFYQVALRLV